MLEKTCSFISNELKKILTFGKSESVGMEDLMTKNFRISGSMALGILNIAFMESGNRR